MIYPEYKDAAERHLETCFNIANQVAVFEVKRQTGGLSASEIRTQTNLLSNLYYLSGYMIECLYSYAMCKYEHNRQSPRYPISGDVKTILDNAAAGTYKICYDNNRRNTLSVSYSIVRRQHRMSLAELAFFQSEGVLSISIPLLDNTTQLSNIDLQNLFLNWSAYERYRTNYYSVTNFPIFDYTTVVMFFWELVDVCAKMSQHIIREVTLFRKVIKKKPSTI